MSSINEVTEAFVNSLAESFKSLHERIATLEDHRKACIADHQETDGSIGRLGSRLSKLEAAVNEFMVEARGHMDRQSFLNDRVAKRDKGIGPDPGVAHVAEEGEFRSVPYDLAITVKSSPKNIPFSIALEYLKAGRRIKRSGWYNGEAFGPSSKDIAPEAHEWTWSHIIANDWEVLPEKS